MDYTKAMIDLVFQIRKIVPDDLRSQIKLTNPELLGLLLSAYPTFEDQTLRAAVIRLAEMAGAASPYIGNTAIGSPHLAPAKQRRETQGTGSGSNDPVERRRKKSLIYRGHTVIED